MRENRKGLIIAIILLLIGTSVTPTICGDINGLNDRSILDNQDKDAIGAITATDTTENHDASLHYEEQIVIYLDGGKDLITYVGQQTLFTWYAISPTEGVIEYEWDFNEDGIFDFTNRGYAGQFLQTAYIYRKEGTYNATLKATNSYDNSSIFYDYVKVIVKDGFGNQTYIEEVGNEIETNKSPDADGTTEKYAVMINGGYEDRFWIDVNFTYHMLIDDYNYIPDNIYLLNHDGTNPDGKNPNDMIDYPATHSNIVHVFNILSGIIDSDDLLFVWVDDHGMGYFGPGTSYHGFLYSCDAPFIDPGDEEDYLESNFKLRSFCVYGNYYSNMGMDVWKVHKKWDKNHNCYRYYRLKYVSSFEDVFFEIENTTLSNNDVYIEMFIDYLEGDYDKDGFIETEEGEVYDFDGDGIQPYDPDSGIFDEDDWGEIHHFENITHLNTGVPQNSSERYRIFDDGFDNHVDIDLHYTGGNLEVDGTDIDNQGLFDGIDINEDGDMNDWVSIDEQICLYQQPELRDDELQSYLNNINANFTIIFMEPCFSGGFIWDLSLHRRLICTATVEEDSSWGNYFVRGFTSALHGADIYGNPVDADSNGDGNISIAEAFNYAAENDPCREIPQYDDNGDGISHAHPIPNGGDGYLGLVTFLWGLAVGAIPPEITNIQAIPFKQVIGGYVNISAVVTDNVAVDTVTVDITGPTFATEEMTNMPGTDTYYYNATYTEVGTYDYFIWANDTSGNEATSLIKTFEIIEHDTTPPVTTHDFDGTMGENKWYVSDVTVILTATDETSGVAYTMYKLDDGDWETYINLFPITEEGIHTLYYYSVDFARNVEDTNEADFKIDQTPPEVTLEKQSLGLLIFKFIANISDPDPSSGIDRVEFYFDGDLRETVTEGSYVTNGSYEWICIGYGNHTVTATVYDNAGNSATSEGITPHSQMLLLERFIQRFSILRHLIGL